MQIPVKRMLRTRGALVAAVTALAVGLTFLAGRVLLQLVLAAGFDSFGLELLTSILPFTVGYFLALWTVAPITERMGVGHAITRSILATGIGATLWFVVLGLLGVVSAIASGVNGIGNGVVSLLISAWLAQALQQALAGLIVVLPLGVLGGVLQWVWRGANPAPHHIEGLIDV